MFLVDKRVRCFIEDQIPDARAASGHATAAPPSVAKNFRRRM
jgi:hypothetical protein